jgi:2-methylcitrate dehydratase PrpD
MSKQPTGLLAEYVHNLQWDALPAEVVESAKLRVLDYLASAMAGYRLNRTFSETVTRMYRDMGGAEESRVLFSDLRLPAPNAAFLNAAYGHGADIDDGHRAAQGHPGIVVIPAAFALAEAERRNGKDVILSIVAGYDVFVRLASAVNPAHFNRGFHSTGTVGTVAAGAAAAKVLKLDFNGVRNAISLAAVQAAGVHEISESAQASKPLSPAKAAYGGVLAARMASLGIEGPREALEGSKGFIKAFTDKFDFEVLQNKLGQRFDITGCYVKLYPACRHCHGAIDAAIRLREAGDARLDSIDKIKVFIYPAAIKIVGSIFEPASADEAKFSLPYAVATALHNGSFTLADLDVAHSFHSSIRELVRKVEIVGDPALENRAAKLRGSRVQLLFNDGTSKEIAVTLPKGDPEVPVIKADVENKLRLCAQGLIPTDRQEALISTVWELEKMPAVDRLLTFCTSFDEVYVK